jgi:hypothetical protein
VTTLFSAGIEWPRCASDFTPRRAAVQVCQLIGVGTPGGMPFLTTTDFTDIRAREKGIRLIRQIRGRENKYQ